MDECQKLLVSLIFLVAEVVRIEAQFVYPYTTFAGELRWQLVLENALTWNPAQYVVDSLPFIDLFSVVPGAGIKAIEARINNSYRFDPIKFIALKFISYGRLESRDPTGTLMGYFNPVFLDASLAFNLYRSSNLLLYGVPGFYAMRVDGPYWIGISGDIYLIFHRWIGRGWLIYASLTSLVVPLSSIAYRDERIRYSLPELTISVQHKFKYAPFSILLNFHRSLQWEYTPPPDVLKPDSTLVSKATEIFQRLLTHLSAAIIITPVDALNIIIGYSIARRSWQTIEYRKGVQGLSAGLIIRDRLIKVGAGVVFTAARKPAWLFHVGVNINRAFVKNKNTDRKVIFFEDRGNE